MSDNNTKNKKQKHYLCFLTDPYSDEWTKTEWYKIWCKLAGIKNK